MSIPSCKGYLATKTGVDVLVNDKVLREKLQEEIT
jgi:hypothetical protein